MIYNKIRKYAFLSLFVIGAAFISAEAKAADVVIIANPSVGISSITSAEAKKVFLGKGKEVSGNKVKVAGLSKGGAYDMFLAKVLNMTDSDVEKYWVQESLKGGAKKIKSLKSTKSLISYVSKKKGYIGYISSDDVDAAKAKGLKVINITY